MVNFVDILIIYLQSNYEPHNNHTGQYHSTVELSVLKYIYSMIIFLSEVKYSSSINEEKGATMFKASVISMQAVTSNTIKY